MLSFTVIGEIYEKDKEVQKFGNDGTARKIAIKIQDYSYTSKDGAKVFDRMKLEAYNEAADDIMNNYRCGDIVKVICTPKLNEKQLLDGKVSTFQTIRVASIEKLASKVGDTVEDQVRRAEMAEKDAPLYDLKNTGEF